MFLMNGYHWVVVLAATAMVMLRHVIHTLETALYVKSAAYCLSVPCVCHNQSEYIILCRRMKVSCVEHKS